MDYSTIELKELSEYPGIAKDMDAFFHPDNCKECIMVRKGHIKSNSGGSKYCLMAATKYGGDLNVVVYSRNNFNKWEVEMSFSQGSFDKFIENKYNIIL